MVSAGECVTEAEAGDVVVGAAVAEMIRGGGVLYDIPSKYRYLSRIYREI